MLCIATLTCGASCETPDPGRSDASASKFADASNDVDAATSPVVDVPVMPCPQEPVSVRCFYSGYRTPCSVGCSYAPSCTFALAAQWQGGFYCCSPYVSYYGCRCVAGQTICLEGDAGVTPTSYCHFCGPPDSGVLVDAG